MAPAYEPTASYYELFPDSCARWKIAPDAKSARNLATGAELSFHGVDENGPVFLTNYKYIHSEPGDDLKPLMFSYTGPEFSFEFNVFRQIALSYFERKDTLERLLLWKLDLDSVFLSMPDGRENHINQLEQVKFNIIRDDLLDILRIWPDHPDEIGKVPEDKFRTDCSLPQHDVIVTGGWLGDQWTKLFFRWSGGRSGFFFRQGYRTKKVRKYQSESSAWKIQRDPKLELIHESADYTLCFDGKHHYERPLKDGSIKKSFYKFLLKTPKETVPIWTEFQSLPKDYIKDSDIIWNLSLANSAYLCAEKSPSETAFTHIRYHKPFFKRNMNVETVKLIESVGVDAILHWPGLEETGFLPPAKVYVSQGYVNGCWSFGAGFQTGHDISLYALFEYTDWKKHWRDM